MVIVQDVPGLLTQLLGFRLRIPAMVALFTGMRLGEVLALRWSRVDLDRKVLEVREALEQTKTHGIRFKKPKSKAGRRDITLPDVLVDALREHRKSMLELRMQLGLGRLPDDALLFADLYGNPLFAQRSVCRVGRFRGSRRNTGRDIPRAASHPPASSSTLAWTS
jgi:integrase